MRRILALTLCFLVIFLTACSLKNTTEPKSTKKISEEKQTEPITETEQKTGPIEKELLTPEIVIEKLCELGSFDYTLQTPGCNEVYNEQIDPLEPVVKSYLISDNYAGEYIRLLCFASEEDAITASETYNGFDYINRFGAMYLFGSSACIEFLDLFAYEHPRSFTPETTEPPAADSVAGIVKAIEDETELCGGYYSEQLIESTEVNINNKLILEGDILNLVHLTHHDGSVLRFVYIYEFETENDAILYGEDRNVFAQSIEDGVCVRSGNKVIFGNHGIISEILV